MSVSEEDSCDDIEVDICSTDDQDSRLSSHAVAEIDPVLPNEDDDSQCESVYSSTASVSTCPTSYSFSISKNSFAVVTADPQESEPLNERSPMKRGKSDVQEEGTWSIINSGVVSKGAATSKDCGAIALADPISDIRDHDQAQESNSNRFCFESDHLALKGNKDYQLLLKTLVVLEAQRTKAVHDLQELESWKEKAMNDPIQFVEMLQKKELPKFPRRQMIAKHPEIDFAHYLVTYSSLKLPKGAKINTRKSLKEVDKGEIKPAVSNRASPASDSSPDPSNHVSKVWDEVRPPAASQHWTNEEQERLEKLLHVYPPEEIESRRWGKIAEALGNRTAIQVASRVQKYFIKLAKAGLPVPGRVPSLHNIRRAKANRASYRNSTFFPSWKPQVYMNEDDDDSNSAHSMSAAGSSNDIAMDDIPIEFQDSEEYRELLQLRHIRRTKGKEKQEVIHRGFSCDLCGMDPIIGQRWHCKDCLPEESVDFCDSCSRVEKTGLPQHNSSHKLEAVAEERTCLDDDYLRFEQLNGEYNYLDSNFIPTGK